MLCTYREGPRWLSALLVYDCHQPCCLRGIMCQLIAAERTCSTRVFYLYLLPTPPPPPPRSPVRAAARVFWYRRGCQTLGTWNWGRRGRRGRPRTVQSTGGWRLAEAPQWASPGTIRWLSFSAASMFCLSRLCRGWGRGVGMSTLHCVGLYPTVRSH